MRFTSCVGLCTRASHASFWAGCRKHDECSERRARSGQRARRDRGADSRRPRGARHVRLRGPTRAAGRRTRLPTRGRGRAPSAHPPQPHPAYVTGERGTAETTSAYPRAVSPLTPPPRNRPAKRPSRRDETHRGRAPPRPQCRRRHRRGPRCGRRSWPRGHITDAQHDAGRRCCERDHTASTGGRADRAYVAHPHAWR